MLKLTSGLPLYAEPGGSLPHPQRFMLAISSGVSYEGSIGEPSQVPIIQLQERPSTGEDGFGPF